MGAGSAAEQVKLLLFDSVLCIASGTVDVAIEHFWIIGHVGNQEAWIGALLKVFGFDDESPFFSPTPRPVA